MIRGTTPTHVFTLPFETTLVSSARVIYKQGTKEVIRKENEDIIREGKALRLTLSEEETLRLDCRLSVKIQLRVRTIAGQVLATKPMIVTVDECLDNEVLT